MLKQCLLPILLILLFAQPCLSCWKYIPLNELVADSDLIVVGTLTNVRLLNEPKKHHGMLEYEASLHIEEYLGGRTNPGTECRFRWNYHPGLSANIDRSKDIGKKLIWLLNEAKDENGLSYWTAGRPDRDLELDQLDTIRRMVGLPICFIVLDETHYYDYAGQPVNATLTISTFQDQLELSDYPKVEDGNLVLHGDLRIDLTFDGEEVIKKDPVRKGPGDQKIVITRENPLTVECDLTRYFDFNRPGKYSVWFGIHEGEPAGRWEFFIVEPPKIKKAP